MDARRDMEVASVGVEVQWVRRRGMSLLLGDGLDGAIR